MQTTTGKIFGIGFIIAAIIFAAFTHGADAARKVRKKPVSDRPTSRSGTEEYYRRLRQIGRAHV